MGGDSLSVPILYEANATDFNNLGLGPLVDTTVATVTEERNGQFILEMQYPVDGIRASLIAKNRILKVDAGHKLKDQRFVIKRINRIMGNDGLSYSIYAEHISYITADYALKPNLTISGSGNVAMTQWLNGIIDSNRIHADSDITTENTTSWTIDKVQNARQALGGVQGSILDVWGGEYRFDNLNISLLKHRGTVSNTMLSYGRNITDFDQEENITNTYTSIYPFASYSVQNGDASDQKILTIPNLVVDSEYVNNFPNRKIQVVDFSDKFSTDEKPTVERLVELAKSYIKSNKVGVPTVSTKISFVDLSKTENYKEFSPLEELDLCDEVPFVFDKFGIKTTAKISRIVWNVLLDSYDSLELGELKTNLSDVINNTNNAALDAKDAANDAKNSADNAALSANGKNRNWYGADDPAFGHLSELREGDSWYKPNGEDTELYHWINGQWVFILSTKDTHEAKDAADTAQKEAEEAKTQANESVAAANDAVAKAGFATDTATQAKSDAAAAGQQAKDALTSAGTALTDAKKALTNSSSAMADSAQARKDSATAKIQATNAAIQANQAVTDASTAKADANTAKGQAANALGQANTAINNAANALDKFNNMQVGGRNLYLNSKTIKDTYSTINSTTVTVEPFDSATNMWHIVGKQGSGFMGIFLPYTANGKLPDSSDWAYSADIKGTGNFYLFGIETGNRNPVVGTIGSEWSRVSQTGRFVNATKKVIVMYFDTTSSPLDVYIKLPKLEIGNTPTDWSPAPEDVQQQFTNIDGELASKVSQTTYNVLAGTVDTVNTLAKQNQSTISTLATKTSVDTVNKTATTAQTIAQQNANELLNKASSTTVNTLTQRVTTAESTLSQTATKAELALTKTDVDKLGDTVASQSLDIAATANTLKLKADRSTVSDLDGRVTSLSGQLDVQSDLISAKVTASDVTGMLNGYATQTWTQGQIKTTADSINLNVSKVQTDLSGTRTQFAELVVKVDGIQTTVSGKADQSQVTQMAGQITSLIGSANNPNLIPNSGLPKDTLFWRTNDTTRFKVATHAFYTKGSLFALIAPQGTGTAERTAGTASVSVTRGATYTASLGVFGDSNVVGCDVFWLGRKHGETTDTKVLLLAGNFKPNPSEIEFKSWTFNVGDCDEGYIRVDNNGSTSGESTLYFGEVKLEKGGRYTPWEQTAESSEIVQTREMINLRVQKGDVINQINISPESILIAGQKVHITGQTSIDNAVIKDAMIADIKADKITAGTLNAANVNVINLNANNITTGTIKGANLSLNLNTGEVLFQKGAIRSTNGKLNIDVNDGTLSIADSLNRGVIFRNGIMSLSDITYGSNVASKYGTVSFEESIIGSLGTGMKLSGAHGTLVGMPDYHPDSLFSPTLQFPTTGGVGISKNYLNVEAARIAALISGKSYLSVFVQESPTVQVGADLSYTAGEAWTLKTGSGPETESGSNVWANGKVIAMEASGSNTGSTGISVSDLSLAVDSVSGYVLSMSAYRRTYSSGKTATITPSGVLGTISSASKYKLAIGEISTINDEAHRFLSVKPKQWFDKTESDTVADMMTTGNDNYVDDAKTVAHTGFIAEDLYTAGLDSYVIRGNDGSLESIQYDRLPVLHHELIRELFNRLDAAELEIYKLKQEANNAS